MGFLMNKEPENNIEITGKYEIYLKFSEIFDKYIEEIKKYYLGKFKIPRKKTFINWLISNYYDVYKLVINNNLSFERAQLYQKVKLQIFGNSPN